MNSDLSKGDILIVDDTLDNLRLLSTMLIEQGYDVRSVTNGATALMGIRAQAPDLILLDINMPGMTGYELCEQLKRDRTTAQIPVIFISALNEIFDKVKAFAIGGVDYIAKPFQVEEVLVRIENQLALRRLQIQLETQNIQLQETEIALRDALAQAQNLNQQIEAMATLEERHRIARDIHDSLGHALVALNIQMETALTLWKTDPNKAYRFLQEAKQLGSDALKAVRQSVGEMRSNPLQGELFADAIAKLAAEFHTTTGIEPQCHINLRQPVTHSVSTVVCRIVQEGLTNILKHAAATAVHINIASDVAGVQVVLKDNGKGLCDEMRSGFGLQGMHERVQAVGGQLEVISAPGSGCKITASFPHP